MTMQPKRLLIVTVTLGLGGAEMQLTELAIRLHRRGWEVAVVSMLGMDALTIPLKEAGVEVFSLDLKRGRWDPRGILRLSSIVRSWKPTVVHSHMAVANVLTRVSRLFCKMPILVCTAHSVYEHPIVQALKGRIFDQLYRWTDFLCDATTNICTAGAQRYVAEKLVPAQKLRKIYNGIDCHKFRPRPELREATRIQLGLTQFTWLAIGRLEIEKDLPKMLKAFALLQNRVETKHRLLLVGLGRLQKQMEELVQSLGLVDTVSFLGPRTDIDHILSAVDGYLMSSLNEGLPIVLLEASAASLPIVSTNVGGVSEIVLDGKSGLLVQESSTEAFSEAMWQLCQMSAGERQEMGNQGRAWVLEKFGFEPILDSWESLYRELLSKRDFSLA